MADITWLKRFCCVLEGEKKKGGFIENKRTVHIHDVPSVQYVYFGNFRQIQSHKCIPEIFVGWISNHKPDDAAALASISASASQNCS